jgi:hypothetical protein
MMARCHHERRVGFVISLGKMVMKIMYLCSEWGLLFHSNAMDFYRNIYPFIWIMPWDCVAGYMYSHWIRMMPWDYVNGFVLSLDDDDVMGFCSSVHSFIG